MNRLSEFLFARPSFIEGIARLLDVGGFLDDYNRSQTPEEADSRATAADWQVVGDDLRTAMQTTIGQTSAAA